MSTAIAGPTNKELHPRIQFPSKLLRILPKRLALGTELAQLLDFRVFVDAEVELVVIVDDFA
jgi:hypothetical protein